MKDVIYVKWLTISENSPTRKVNIGYLISFVSTETAFHGPNTYAMVVNLETQKFEKIQYKELQVIDIDEASNFAKLILGGKNENKSK